MAVMVAFEMKIQTLNQWHWLGEIEIKTLNQPMTNLDWGEIGFFCNIITVPVFPDHPDINRITNPIKRSLWSKTLGLDAGQYQQPQGPVCCWQAQRRRIHRAKRGGWRRWHRRLLQMSFSSPGVSWYHYLLLMSSSSPDVSWYHSLLLMSSYSPVVSWYFHPLLTSRRGPGMLHWLPPTSWAHLYSVVFLSV